MKTSFKTGDRVRIINPEFFVRCGYPETLESARKKMEEEYKELGSLNLFFQKHFPFLSNCNFASFETEQIINILSKAYNKNVLKFGGKERKIFTERKPEIEGEEMVVMHFERPLIKKTGTYRIDHEYNEYSGESYSIPYLGNVKTRVFYPVGADTYVYHPRLNMGEKYWIERENLEKL